MLIKSVIVELCLREACLVKRLPDRLVNGNRAVAQFIGLCICFAKYL